MNKKSKVMKCTMGVGSRRVNFSLNVAVPTALCGTKTLSMAVLEKRFNVMETMCLRSICGVTW